MAQVTNQLLFNYKRHVNIILTTTKTKQLAVPGVRSESSSFHLNLPAAARVLPEQFGILARRHLHFSEVTGRSVAQLPGELSELVAAVAVSRGLGSRHDLRAAEVLRSQRVVHDLVPVQPQQCQGLSGHSHEPRLAERLRVHPGETRSFHLTHPGLLGGVHGKFLENYVVEVEPLQGGATQRRTHVVHADRAEESDDGDAGEETACRSQPSS